LKKEKEMDIKMEIEKGMSKNKIISNASSSANANEKFLGFQVLPIKYLERNNLSCTKENKLHFEIINKKPEDYFVKEEGHVLNLKNHDPKNYRIEDDVLNEYNQSKLNYIIYRNY